MSCGWVGNLAMRDVELRYCDRATWGRSGQRFMRGYAEAEQDILRDVRHAGELLNLSSDFGWSDCSMYVSTESLVKNERLDNVKPTAIHAKEEDLISPS